MAIRTLVNIFLVPALLLCFAGDVHACFGPKLFVAAGQSPEEQILYALVTLYVEEKTGVESNRVDVGTENPLNLIRDDKADLVFAGSAEQGENVVFLLEGLPVLVTGKRPVEDLQFTTVLLALEKLQKAVSRDEVISLIAEVEKGASAMAVVRKFFMQNRLI